MKLYDTLERRPVTLRAADGATFRFYCCGPTVYGPAHIGNFRTFVLQDVLRRALEVAGLRPVHVRNITDVDDKTIRDARAAGEPLRDFTERWTRRFHADGEALNLLPPHVEPRATEHIAGQINLVRQLISKGHAYAAPDGSVYFKVSSFPGYGKLSHLDRRELQTQATTSAGEVNDADEYERESLADFALWKARKPDDGENAWPSPWGPGRPGWHLECSAMSMQYLGETFDLHAGGIDLCFPHHENEIAQSEAATGRPFAQHWWHTTHLLVEGAKMSKSAGNLYTLDDLAGRGHRPMEVRYTLLSAHYRKPLNFTFNGLHAAAGALQKLERGAAALLAAAGLGTGDFPRWQRAEAPADWGLFAPAWAALEDDLNTAECTGHLFTALKEIEAGPPAAPAAHGALAALGALTYALGLQLFTRAGDGETAPGPPEKVTALAEQRWKAKGDRDWATADALREEIRAQGWQVLDRKDGYELEPAGAGSDR